MRRLLDAARTGMAVWRTRTSTSRGYLALRRTLRRQAVGWSGRVLREPDEVYHLRLEELEAAGEPTACLRRKSIRCARWSGSAACRAELAGVR